MSAAGRLKTRDKIIIGAAMACLAVAAGIWTEVRTARRMRAAVERALEMNRNYETFTSDTVLLYGDSTQRISLRDAVDFYDHPLHHLWASPNQRLRAGYALGCVYRDLHEAPIAIITWEDAVAAADTTSADCDYATLYRVYGQMAEIYFRQYMPEKQLEAQQKYSDYALMAGDTSLYIKGLLARNDAYLSLGDTSAVFENIEHIRQLYHERGLTKEAAQVYPSAIHIALDRGEYEKADSMMQIFEQKSGLFDEQGNIEPTRERYYFDKGRYFAGVGQLDSAEIQFRRLLPIEENRVDACHGLLFLFQYQQRTDSVAKYALLYNYAIATHLSNTQTEAVIQADALYDFERQKQEAYAEEQKAKRWRTGGILATLLACIVALIIYLYYSAAKAEKDRKEQELRHVKENYNSTLEHLNQAHAEAQILQRSLSDRDALVKLLKEKEEQVVHFEVMVKDLNAQIDQLQHEPIRVNARESKVVSHFQYIATNHYSKDRHGIISTIPSRCATNEEWDQMLDMFQECRPYLYLLLKESKLTDALMKVCILSRYGFKNPDISTLTGLETKYVTNIRTKLAKEIFHLNSAYELNKYLIGIQ